MRKLIPMLMLLVAAACSKDEAIVSGAAPPPVQKQGAQFAGADVARNESAPPMPRMIVRTANVKIIVDDTSKVVEVITKSVEAAGGYVSDSNIWRDGELLRAKITLRVPADQLTSTLGAIRAVAKRVDNETITSDEVTQEYVDLESQVRNLEATEVELRELLKVARVNSKRATEVLEVHQQVTIVRGQIEQAKGRMRYLSQLAAMASIALDVVPDAMAQPVVEPGWQPLVVIKDASRALVSLLQRLTTAAIWFVIYLLPILGMLAVAIFVVTKIARRARTREA